MVFTSNLFLFIFLPVFLATYYVIPFRSRSALILVFSYIFYGWWRPDFALLLGAVSVGTVGSGGKTASSEEGVDIGPWFTGGAKVQKSAALSRIPPGGTIGVRHVLGPQRLGLRWGFGRCF